MGIGTSLVLIAIGAILRWAITSDVSGVNIHTIGLIVLIVGIVGLIISLVWVTIWADHRRGTVVRDDPYRDPYREPRP